MNAAHTTPSCLPKFHLNIILPVTSWSSQQSLFPPESYSPLQPSLWPVLRRGPSLAFRASFCRTSRSAPVTGYYRSRVLEDIVRNEYGLWEHHFPEDLPHPVTYGCWQRRTLSGDYFRGSVRGNGRNLKWRRAKCAVCISTLLGMRWAPLRHQIAAKFIPVPTRSILPILRGGALACRVFCHTGRFKKSFTVVFQISL
jgi:hypothetical protein